MRFVMTLMALITLSVAVLVRPVAVVGQEGPDPSLCQVEPRSSDWLTALFATPVALDASPSASPAASPAAAAELPPGEPAGPDVLFAINETLVEIVACANAGDARRALALFTDDVSPETLSLLGLYDPALLTAGPPTPVPTDEWAPFLSIRDPRVLPDGRVGAIVSNDTQPEQTYFIIFEEQDGRWLIDEAFPTEAGGAAGP